ncbi:hypothetical protein ACFQJC_01115 [Haloferax namakaokahaiae]|uniref:DUF3784 domain-containing protein n=1 Tax=Haloferax namakaokahaiae TaxID=1748331 RepID=A0ABD5ZA86_9EURY
MNPLQITEMFEGLIFFLPFVLLVVVMLAFLAGIAYFEHKKEMALIESGQYLAADRDPRAWILAGGLVVLALGLGDVVSSLLSGTDFSGGITAVFLGIAALAYYFYKRRALAATTVA